MSAIVPLVVPRVVALPARDAAPATTLHARTTVATETGTTTAIAVTDATARAAQILGESRDYLGGVN